MTTITEGLAELKTIDKRIEKKIAFIANHAMREARVKDPLEKDGGSTKILTAELQAIHDLEERKVEIRTAIQQKNLEVQLSIGSEKRSVAQWLHWRRDVSQSRKQYLNALLTGINTNREMARSKKKNVKTEETDSAEDVILHLDELSLAKQSEGMETILGELDGKLSLINATTQIDI